jgi:hypothetical protein
LRMKWRMLRCLALALFLLAGVAELSAMQDSDAPQVVSPKPPQPQFFAGQVVEVDAEHVKVSRNLLGRAPETRVFKLDGKTKTPKGGIKPKTRVTVRYEHLAQYDLALEIEVRPANRSPKIS